MRGCWVGGLEKTTLPKAEGVWKVLAGGGMGDQVESWGLVLPPIRLMFKRHSSPSRGGVWAASRAKLRRGTFISTIQ